MNDRSALKSLRKGSQDGLDWIIRRYAPYVGAVIRNIIGERMAEADVEEAASDVFLVLWEKAADVRPESLKGFLAGVARNKAMQKLRAAGNDLPLEGDALEIAAPEEYRLEKEELRIAVRRAVLEMGSPDRDIFLRHYFLFQPIVRIAREMSMSEAAVKSRLFRGREKLKAALEKLYDSEGGI